MRWLETACGCVLVLIVLRDAFETMILPRRLNGRLRFTRLYYRLGWPLWAWIARHVTRGRQRETALSLFGPLSMLLLFVIWAVGLVFGFALVYLGLGSPLQTSEPLRGLGMDVYLSGTMFLTLGLGNAVPHTNLSRALAVCEGGMGFGFVAVIISYLPILYGGFSTRESNISMLDARAGSPPSASELLRRHANDRAQLQSYLAEWEHWAAQLLESQISYPVLGFFRSQHVNQSWLAALTTVLDACAFVIATGDDACTRQAQLTFAMGRHAVVDLAQIFLGRRPTEVRERLSDADLERLRGELAAAGWGVSMDETRRHRLLQLRNLYDAHVQSIGLALELEVPAWIGNADHLDNWQRSPWDKSPALDIRSHY